MWSLFLDDIRFPPNTDKNWKLARSVGEAIVMIEQFGYPNHVSFDHDLGENDVPNGLQLAKHLVELDLDHNLMPDGFSFYVHSDNPAGAENIRSYMQNYMRVK